MNSPGFLDRAHSSCSLSREKKELRSRNLFLVPLDLISEDGETKGMTRKKQRASKKSLATHYFHQDPDKAIVVTQVMN